MKRQPSAVTKPPMTAVRRVDFRRQKAMITGEANKLMPIDNAPSQPETETGIQLIMCVCFVF